MFDHILRTRYVLGVGNYRNAFMIEQGILVGYKGILVINKESWKFVINRVKKK